DFTSISGLKSSRHRSRTTALDVKKGARPRAQQIADHPGVGTSERASHSHIAAVGDDRAPLSLQQFGEVKATPGNTYRSKSNEDGLGALLFQVIRQILSHFTKFAVKDSYLPPRGPVKSDHRRIIGSVGCMRPAPINNACASNSKEQYERPNYSQSPGAQLV